MNAVALIVFVSLTVAISDAQLYTTSTYDQMCDWGLQICKNNFELFGTSLETLENYNNCVSGVDCIYSSNGSSIKEQTLNSIREQLSNYENMPSGARKVFLSLATLTACLAATLSTIRG